MAQYIAPGLTITKETRQITSTIGSTQRFPMFVGIGQNTLDIINEPVVRGHDDNPTDPASAPKNGKDSLSRAAVQLLNVGSQPGLNDFIRNLDFILTDGKIDWGPQIVKSINNENSVSTDGTYKININKPKGGTLISVRNFSTFQSAENLVIGTNATFSSFTNVVTIQLSRTFLSNLAGNGFASFGNSSLIFHNDLNNRFLLANQIDFSTPFSLSGQWKVDFQNGVILSYNTSDATLASGLNVDYMYVADYDVTNFSVDPVNGLFFVLDPVLQQNLNLPTFLSTDFLNVTYTSVTDGNEPVPGSTYYVTYKALKNESELNPEFFGPGDRLKFQTEYGAAEEFLTGNQIALAGEIQFALGTAGFFVSPVRADSVFEWGEALQRTSELFYDDLVILNDDPEVKALARKLGLDRSSPIKKRRTIIWFASEINQPNGLSPSDSGSILAELEVLRNERVIFLASVRKDQTLLVNIPRNDGTVTTNVPVPMYWGNVSIVNTVDSFSSPSTSALRTALQFFTTNVSAEQYTSREADILAGAGAMLLEDTLGSARIRDDVTTVSSFGSPDQAELSVRTAEDALVQRIIEPAMDRSITGLKITDRSLIISQATSLLNDLLAQSSAAGIIRSGQTTTVQFDPKDPRRLLFSFSFEPIFTLKVQSGTYSITLPR